MKWTVDHRCVENHHGVNHDIGQYDPPGGYAEGNIHPIWQILCEVKQGIPLTIQNLVNDFEKYQLQIQPDIQNEQRRYFRI